MYRTTLRQKAVTSVEDDDDKGRDAGARAESPGSYCRRPVYASSVRVAVAGRGSDDSRRTTPPSKNSRPQSCTSTPKMSSGLFVPSKIRPLEKLNAGVAFRTPHQDLSKG